MKEKNAYASKIIHTERDESRVGEPVHQKLRIARHSPDVWKIQHHIAVGLLRRRDVGWYIKDGFHLAAWGSRVDRAEPAAGSRGLSQILLVTGGSHDHRIDCGREVLTELDTKMSQKNDECRLIDMCGIGYLRLCGVGNLRTCCRRLRLRNYIGSDFTYNDGDLSQHFNRFEVETFKYHLMEVN